MSRTVKMSKLPSCNFCSEEARYDAPVLGHSSWAYFCPDCWASRGSHTQYTELRAETEDERARDQRGSDEFDPELEASFMENVDLEAVMSESLFGASCGVEVADGCVVEPDGKCCHGYSSPLILAGLM
jgi:hypothetical protein